MLRPWQFRDRTCAKLKVPTTQLMKNKHHRVLSWTQDEVIMKKWNLNWQYFTLKIGCFPSSTVQNLKPQSKFHEYELCLHIIRIRIVYWCSMVCSGYRRDRFGVTMTFRVLLKMAVWQPPMEENIVHRTCIHQLNYDLRSWKFVLQIENYSCWA